MTGPVALWLGSKGIEITTVDELCDKLVRQFHGTNFTNLINAQLHSMHQFKTKDVISYVNCFQYLYVQGGVGWLLSIPLWCVGQKGLFGSVFTAHGLQVESQQDGGCLLQDS